MKVSSGSSPLPLMRGVPREHLPLVCENRIEHEGSKTREDRFSIEDSKELTNVAKYAVARERLCAAEAKTSVALLMCAAVDEEITCTTTGGRASCR